MPLSSKFGERYEKLRKSKHLSREVVATRLGLHSNSLRAYEKGQTPVDLNMAEKMALAIEVNLWDLLFPGKMPDPIRLKPTTKEALEILTEAIRDFEKLKHLPTPPPQLTGRRARLIPILEQIHDDDAEIDVIARRLKIMLGLPLDDADSGDTNNSGNGS